MFSAQLQFKFTSVAQAKIAAGNISQMLKEKISTFDIHGLQVTVGKDGDLAVNVRFDDMSAMKNFERQVPAMLEDTKQAFVYKFSRFSGVCVLSFEREAMSASIPIDSVPLK